MWLLVYGCHRNKIYFVVIERSLYILVSIEETYFGFEIPVAVALKSGCDAM